MTPPASRGGNDIVGDGACLWRRVATGASPAIEPAAARRFADLVSPALTVHLLGGDTIAADKAAHSRLNNRLNGGAQRRWLGEIAAIGVPVVVLKGFALAHTLYADPDVRTIGDLDLLVRAVDRDRLIAALSARGFRFHAVPPPAWGHISQASYVPFVSADGLCNLDIHVHPDCYPAHRSLTTERVFAAARPVDAGGVAFLAPDVGHAFLLCVTNAAKDKFGAFAARKIVDAMLLLRHHRLDWESLTRLAQEGRFRTPYAVFLTLMARLGVPPQSLPSLPPLPRRAALALSGLVDEVARLYPTAPGLARTAWRELTLCTDPSVGLHNLRLRAQGLVRPARGIPADALVR